MGSPRMSSPIILRRDADTLNYLNRKQHLGGLSLTMLNKIWNSHSNPMPDAPPS